MTTEQQFEEITRQAIREDNILKVVLFIVLAIGAIATIVIIGAISIMAAMHGGLGLGVVWFVITTVLFAVIPAIAILNDY